MRVKRSELFCVIVLQFFYAFAEIVLLDTLVFACFRVVVNCPRPRKIPTLYKLQILEDTDTMFSNRFLQACVPLSMVGLSNRRRVECAPKRAAAPNILAGSKRHMLLTEYPPVAGPITKEQHGAIIEREAQNEE